MNKAFILDVMNTTVSCGVMETIIKRGPYCTSSVKADNWIRDKNKAVLQNARVKTTFPKFYI